MVSPDTPSQPFKCPHDIDGDGDCHVCFYDPAGCIYKPGRKILPEGYNPGDAGFLPDGPPYYLPLTEYPVLLESGTDVAGIRELLTRAGYPNDHLSDEEVAQISNSLGFSGIGMLEHGLPFKCPHGIDDVLGTCELCFGLDRCVHPISKFPSFVSSMIGLVISLLGLIFSMTVLWRMMR